MQQLWFINNPMSQYVSGIIVPIFRRASPYITAYGFSALWKSVQNKVFSSDRMLVVLMGSRWLVLAVSTANSQYRFADSLWAGSCSQAISKPVWRIPLLCIQWKSLDDAQWHCLKHVEFHSKNKFEKLVHLVGFIIGNLSWCTVTWTSNYHSSFPTL